MSISTTNDLSKVAPQPTASPASNDAANNTADGANASNANGAANAAAGADDAQQTKLTPTILKQQLNSAILQASLQVSITSKNDPLALVYKTAIENLNDILKPQLGDNAIQNAAGEDNSPEATAGRIVSFVKSAYAMYSQVNPMKDDGSTADHFLSLMQDGVDKGFKEARDILTSLSVLNGDIASNIDKTYDLVKKGLADFAASLKTPATGDDGSGNSGDAGDGGNGTTTTVSVSISVTASRTETTGN